ncbi:MAG: DJ-1/PfpI family protein [Verrucomicrobiae bacterium]|nr:DJ-1/PfpI family protein [Verrucomicrobiae bacterium]
MYGAIAANDIEEAVRQGQAAGGFQVIVADAAAGVLRGRQVTTIPKCRFDVTVCGAEYVEAPVVRCGNLLCARGKKDMSLWMRQFVSMIQDYLTAGRTKDGRPTSLSPGE